MELMVPTDSMFLFSESREHPLHVGGLSLFEPPEGAGPQFVREFYEALIANDEFQPTFRKHPAKIAGGIATLAWAYDDEVDVDYHVRRSALPSPGRVRDLLELTSRVHTALLDRHRPLWEAYVIEGLQDGRFALYT
ncbi:wax ester/triacylglycerol synthase family O-acyltransferase, partial [Mycobacterium kiyosense]